MAGTSQARVPTSRPGWVLWTISRFRINAGDPELNPKTSVLFWIWIPIQTCMVVKASSKTSVELISSTQINCRVEIQHRSTQFWTEFAQHSSNRFGRYLPRSQPYLSCFIITLSDHSRAFWGRGGATQPKFEWKPPRIHASASICNLK